MAETKVNVALALVGTVTAVKPPEDKTLVKSRKGKQVGQSKFNQEIVIVGLTYAEWDKRCDQAVAILKTGKGGKASPDLEKRLRDAEDQIADLTDKLEQAKAKIPKGKPAKE